MDPSHLKTFLHLCQSGSFAATARACHLSPPTLSRLIQRLEAETGALLIERGRRAEPTPAGQRFARYAQESLSALEQLKADLGGDCGALSGTIRLFASVTAGYSMLPDLLGRFRQAHQWVRFELEVGSSEEAEGRLNTCDLVIGALSPGAASEALPLASTPLVLVARSGGATNPLAQPFELIVNRHRASRGLLDPWLTQRDQQPLRVTEVGGSEAVLTLVALGAGVGVVPHMVLDYSPLAAELTVLPPNPPLGDLTVSLALGAAPSAAARAFYESARPSVG